MKDRDLIVKVWLEREPRWYWPGCWGADYHIVGGIGSDCTWYAFTKKRAHRKAARAGLKFALGVARRDAAETTRVAP